MSRTSIALFIVTILAGIGAMILASGVVQARRVRMEAVESRLDKLGGLDQQIIDDQRIGDKLASELLTEVKVWGRVWDGVGNVGVLDPQQGVMQFGIGANAGLGRGAQDGGTLPNMHVFGLTGGDARYIGEFRATAVNGADTVAKLERLPFAGEADLWQADRYRLRESIPESYNALEASLVADRNIATQDLLESNQRLVRGQAQLQASQDLLDQRMAELNGDPSADPDESPIRSKGLVETIRERSAERDALVAAVDRLRRTYSQKSEELKARLARLKTLSQQLPGGGTAEVPEAL